LANELQQCKVMQEKWLE